MAAEVQKKFGRCDIVINCAGIFPQRDFEDMTYEDWRKLLSINLDSVFLVTSQFVPGMKQRGWGRVVSMSSSTVGSVVTGFVHYVTSKAGIIGFTRALASELGPHGVTVNAIAPGLTKTPGTMARKPRRGMASMDEEFMQVAQMQAIKRPEVPDDLVGTVSYPHQRRRGLHHRPDAQCRRRPGPQLNPKADNPDQITESEERRGPYFRAPPVLDFMPCAG